MASPLTETVTGTFTLPVFNKQGVEVGTVTVDASEFGGKINARLMHEAVLMYEANQRSGTHHTLRRGEVSGSTKKLFRQKGTGNARVGTKRTNKRRGGGTAKGPKPRDYSYALPKKALQSATRMAILAKIRDNEAVIVDDFGLGAIKTKEMAGILKALKLREVPKPMPVVEPTPTPEPVPTPVAGEAPPKTGKTKATKPKKKNLSCLIGTDKVDTVIYKSARNLDGVRVMPTGDFNAYEVLRPTKLVLTKAALESLKQKKA